MRPAWLLRVVVFHALVYCMQNKFYLISVRGILQDPVPPRGNPAVARRNRPWRSVLCSMHKAAICFLCPDGSGGGAESSHCCMPFNTRMLFIGDSTMRCALAFASLCLARAERCEPLPTTLTSRLLAIARGRSVRRTRARAATRSHVDARCRAYTCGSCDLHQRTRAPRPLTPISCVRRINLL